MRGCCPLEEEAGTFIQHLYLASLLTPTHSEGSESDENWGDRPECVADYNTIDDVIGAARDGKVRDCMSNELHCHGYTGVFRH